MTEDRVLETGDRRPITKRGSQTEDRKPRTEDRVLMARDGRMTETEDTMMEDKRLGNTDGGARTEEGTLLIDGPKYKFQRLQVYQLGLDYIDAAYQLTSRLPNSELSNLRRQLERASTSIVLNIAEGSTGQTNAEQARFLGLALRSYIECVACLDVIESRKYVQVQELTPIRDLGHQLFVKIQAMRNSLNKANGHSSRRRSPVLGQEKP